MRFITSEHLKNEINGYTGEETIESKYELVMLIAKRAKQIAEEIAQQEVEEPMLEETVIVKPITVAIDELERNELDIIKGNAD